jgi:undecaprenyl pyrophosphate phosphatase UppP
MSVFMAMLLGLVKGVTVFLPISDSAHEAILYNLFHLTVPEEGKGFFDFLLSLGTLISIIMVYHRELGAILRDGADFARGRSFSSGESEGRFPPTIRMIFFVFIGTLPLLITLPFNTHAGLLMANTVFVGAVMLASGTILFIADKTIKTSRKSEKTMRSVDAFLVVSRRRSALSRPVADRDDRNGWPHARFRQGFFGEICRLPVAAVRCDLHSGFVFFRLSRRHRFGRLFSRICSVSSFRS